jgi:hypothetical protein
MSLIKKQFNTNIPLPTIFLQDWKNELQTSDNVLFDSLDQFVYVVSKITQEHDDMCGISYEKALEKLVKRESDFPKEQQESVRNLVRQNLFKRGLITEEVYEDFRYTTDGTQVGVDVAKYAAGEPDCVITPSKQYIDFFYELYVSISYNCHVTNTTVRNNVAKLLATVEELERQHIFIKINIVLPIKNQTRSENYPNKFFSVIPVFSHKDFKSVDVMSSVVNDRLLRKFFFAILEDLYGSELRSTYGNPMSLSKTINIGNDINEVELFETISNFVGV